MDQFPQFRWYKHVRMTAREDYQKGNVTVEALRRELTKYFFGDMWEVDQSSADIVPGVTTVRVSFLTAFGYSEVTRVYDKKGGFKFEEISPP